MVYIGALVFRNYDEFLLLKNGRNFISTKILLFLCSQAPHQFPPTLPPGQNARNLNSQPFVTLKNRVNDRLTNAAGEVNKTVCA